MNDLNSPYSYPTAQSLGLSVGGAKSDYPSWTEANLPNAEQWHNAFVMLYGGAGAALYPARAERLHAYGWTPEDLISMCTQAQWSHWPSSDVANLSCEAVEAWGALAQEAVVYHDAGASSASFRRLQLMQQLSQFGWNHSQIGAHFGLSKQRVQKLLKNAGI